MVRQQEHRLLIQTVTVTRQLPTETVSETTSAPLRPTQTHMETSRRLIVIDMGIRRVLLAVTLTVMATHRQRILIPMEEELALRTVILTVTETGQPPITIPMDAV